MPKYRRPDGGGPDEGPDRNIIRFPVERRRPPPLLTLRELAAQLSMSERWIRYRIQEGLPVHRYANRLRFNLDEVIAWLDKRYPS